ncbi:MAG: DUF2914 domain-containing protein [Proteobacteria bacterium]|nr:DUF2914 domain-containing protein [Pseudomonadota bacterium]
MKRFTVPPLLALALAALCLMLFLTVQVMAYQSKSLDAEFAMICRDVIDRSAIDVSTSFPVSVGKLFCFTKIVNAQDPTQITHVWYHGSVERARVTLPVNSNSWRTYSSKIIQPHETGDWYVDILDAQGDLLVSVPFKVTQ